MSFQRFEYLFLGQAITRPGPVGLGVGARARGAAFGPAHLRGLWRGRALCGALKLRPEQVDAYIHALWRDVDLACNAGAGTADPGAGQPSGFSVHGVPGGPRRNAAAVSAPEEVGFQRPARRSGERR